MSPTPMLVTALLGTAALALASCASPIRTTYDLDPSADFGRYRSYAWISDEPLIGPRPGVGNTYVSPLDERRIRRAVDAQLAAKGYRRASREQADLVVSFTIGTEQKIQATPTAGRSTVFHPSYGYGTWYGSSPANIRTYTEGSLALEFFEGATKQAVWVGWASKRLSQSDDNEVVLNEAVQKILEPFPAAR